MKSHIWRLDAEGERRPASRMRSRSSEAIGRSAYARTLRREVIASHVSTLLILTRDLRPGLVYDGGLGGRLRRFHGRARAPGRPAKTMYAAVSSSAQYVWR